MIVNNGRNAIRDWLTDSVVSVPTHIGVGTGTTAPAAGNTTLGTEVYPDGASRTSANILRTNNVISYKMTITASQANTNTLAEEGIFTASTSGTMWTRMTHPDLPKNAQTVVPVHISLAILSIV